MGGQAEHTNQQHQHRRTVFNVMIQLTGHTAETQQTHHLQRAEEAADALQERENWLIIADSEDDFNHSELQYCTIIVGTVHKELTFYRL